MSCGINISILANYKLPSANHRRWKAGEMRDTGMGVWGSDIDQWQHVLRRAIISPTLWFDLSALAEGRHRATHLLFVECFAWQDLKKSRPHGVFELKSSGPQSHRSTKCQASRDKIQSGPRWHFSQADDHMVQITMAAGKALAAPGCLPPASWTNGSPLIIHLPTMQRHCTVYTVTFITRQCYGTVTLCD